MRFGYFAATAMLAAAAPAHARDWPETAGWTIGEVDDGCGMMQEYEGKGDTQLYLFLTSEGRVFLTLSNYAWSAVKDEQYDLKFYLNGVAYSGAPSFGIGEKYDSRKGFATQMTANFIDDFANGTGLKILRGETVVDHLDLKGTGQAVTTLKRCVAHVRAEKDAADREKRRLAYIADDPFGGDRSSAEMEKYGEKSPEPRTNPGSWLSDADYPSRAQREERAGTVGYALDVAADGRVTGCQITKSSGHADLDEATCRLLPRRARFESGKAFRYEGEQVWRLPQ